MKINQMQNTPNFKGLYNNKILLSSLEHIADHAASFATGVSFVSAVGLRPLAISFSPKVDKENKKILSIESVASGIAKFLIALGVSIPVENAIKNIKQNPERFLKGEVVDKLSKKEFDFLTSAIKLASNLISAIPKSIIGVALIPLFTNLFKKTKKAEEQKVEKKGLQQYKKQMSFKGDLANNLISSVIESKPAQDFAIKYSKKSQNIVRNTSVVTDIILTAGSIIATNASKNIEKEKKKPLVINKILSSAISIFAGCAIDELVQKAGVRFVENFRNANIDDIKLAKYIEGINVARPTIVFALIYYGVIPLFTTYFVDKFSKDKVV